MYYEETPKGESSCYSVQCEGTTFEGKLINECGINEVKHYGLIKVPAIIGAFTVQIDLETKIKLPETALEIKRIKKNVFLTQCKLIAKAKKVFLKGFVRKNIEYATIDCITPKAICGNIKHATVHVPFQCTAEVKCLRTVDITDNPPSVEINYINEESLGISNKELDLISLESFNEKVYCELEHSSIFEADIIEDAKPIKYHPIEHEFQTFTEKEVVCIKLNLIQNQQVDEGFLE